MATKHADVAPARPTACPADARRRTRAFLDGLDRPLADDAAQTVVLVVSELVTNALRHGGGAYILDLAASPGGIEVAVHDSCSQGPRARVPDLHGGAGGFGWPMVRHLAHDTAVTYHEAGGKTVSALLPR
ncbi:ATP-binding protein [Streptomyces goshikiensis]|uniref:ATP-binding protein n=1 Tax=Streptomyces goshikiensis TaxID=1942 RepID=UPI0037B18BCB